MIFDIILKVVFTLIFEILNHEKNSLTLKNFLCEGLFIKQLTSTAWKLTILINKPKKGSNVSNLLQMAVLSLVVS